MAKLFPSRDTYFSSDAPLVTATDLGRNRKSEISLDDGATLIPERNFNATT